MLYSNSTTDRLLGCLLQEPTLTLNEKYKIDKEEFKVLFHKIVYVVCYNCALEGYKTISIMDFEKWLEPYTSQYEVYLDNNGADYISTVIELTDRNNFEAYYNEFRKFSCLSEYKENGFDIKKFYDEDKSEESQLENLKQYSIEDIIKHYEKLQSNIHTKFLLNDKIEIMTCGDGFDDFLNEVEEEPMIGAGLCSPMLNSLYRGWCKGHLILRGSPSSFGKAQPIDTIIPTPNGNKILGDIKVGDYVFDRYGKPTKVLGVYPQGKIDCYEVEFSDGRKTMCNDEHLWTVYNGHHKTDNKLITKTLSEIKCMMDKDTISIPNCQSVEYKEKTYSVDPYVVGSFLGNGCCKEKYLSLSSKDIDNVSIISNICNIDYKKYTNKNYTWLFKNKDGILIKTKDFF